MLLAVEYVVLDREDLLISVELTVNECAECLVEIHQFHMHLELLLIQQLHLHEVHLLETLLKSMGKVAFTEITQRWHVFVFNDLEQVQVSQVETQLQVELRVGQHFVHLCHVLFLYLWSDCH